MKKDSLAGALALALFSYAAAGIADDNLVRFDGGIGVIPFAGVNATVPALNVVRNQQPGGQPWVISRLTVDVHTDGTIFVDGRGLLLAGGNGIGTNGAQVVHATLFCGPAAAATAFSTGQVPLEANGDFRITDTFNPAPPNPCDTPVLLIQNTANRWFAAGIQKL
jgi:hypothetical protein